MSMTQKINICHLFETHDVLDSTRDCMPPEAVKKVNPPGINFADRVILVHLSRDDLPMYIV